MKVIKYLLWFTALVLITSLLARNYVKEVFFKVFYEESATILHNLSFSLDDYFSDEKILDELVSRWYENLSPEERVAQLIMPAWEKSVSKTKLINWVQNNHIGGFMILRSDLDPEDVEEIINLHIGKVPLFVSVDAEPSLLAYRFPNLDTVAKTASLETDEDIVENAELITFVLQKYGININFAPVYDINKNQSVIGDRSFGSSEEEVVHKANLFAKTMKNNDIIATAKHFPGHGNVEGDTHNSLLMIEGGLEEVGAFKRAVESQVPMIMVGHLAIENNPDYQTDELPSTLSSKIMKNLLRHELGFEGVVITDAMNMGAVAFIADKDIRALEAGADIVLMPSNPIILQRKILTKMKQNPEFALDIEQKIKRVLRLKLAWRLSLQ